MTWWRALRENGATVSMAAISSALLPLLGLVVTAMLSLEAKLAAVSAAWAGTFYLQRFLVGKRRCSGHWLVQYGAMAAYYLPAPLVFYAAKAVSSYYSTSSTNDSTLFLVLGILAMFFFTVLLETELGVLFTNMTAYSLRDRPRGRYSFIMWLVILGYVEWESARVFSSNWKGPGRLVLLLLIVLFHFGVAFSILFGFTSESTLDCRTKQAADYMMKQRESSSSKSSSSSTSPFFDDDDDAISNDSSLRLGCCRYPFARRGDGEWATVKDMVQRNDLPTEHHDIFLSYSLCRLLARRYYGFHCAEEGDDKVRRFALAGLGRTNNGFSYRRAFSIVEVQLAFLYDYFFTASIQIIESGSLYVQVARGSTLGFAVIIITFLSGIVIKISKRGGGDELSSEKTRSLDPFMMVMAQMAMFKFAFEISGLAEFRVQDLLAIYWHPMHTAFHKLNCLSDGPLPIDCFSPPNNPADAHDVLGPFQTQTNGVYWRNKIGQYSILHDYDRRHSPKKALVAWFQRIMLSQPSYMFINHLPVEEEEADMLQLDNMRELVADTLQAIDGPPTNGTRSLKINKDSAGYDYDDWLWTCRKETHTNTILIWHIATCYCDMAPESDDPSVKWYREAARALSRYCAYLVAFLPEFLPEHSLTTKQIFQRVLQQARHELGKNPMKEEEKRTKIRGLQLPDQHEQWTTFHKGVHLGRQLEMLNDDKLRWKVMAEFWAETILYIAPSDNAEAHIERLAKGGEFITHLWAMLSNAGILRRATGEWHPPPASTTTKGPATHQLMEALSIYIDDASTSSMSSLPPRQTSEPPRNEKGKQPRILEDLYQ